MVSLDIEDLYNDQSHEKRDWIETIGKTVFFLYLCLQSGILIVVGIYDDTQYKNKYFVLFGVVYGFCLALYALFQYIYWFYFVDSKIMKYFTASLYFAVLVSFAMSMVSFVYSDFSTAPFYMTYFIIMATNFTILIVCAIISALVILLLK